MIVKVMKPAGSNFPGVDYNDKKVDNEMLFEWHKSSGGAKDPAEDELKKRKKKKR